ncbi:MAG: hypothetical protein HYZ88_02930, partial [Candidatus Omnitrophica bacterium]|nr:hypothetical protein [Candidatus Omnitrophota bacterium]
MPGAAHPQAGYFDALSETGRGLSESRVGGTNGAEPGAPKRGPAGDGPRRGDARATRQNLEPLVRA